MKRSSEKKNWDEYWEASSDLDDVYSNDGRIEPAPGATVTTSPPEAVSYTPSITARRPWI
jgi:hypothetical protein